MKPGESCRPPVGARGHNTLRVVSKMSPEISMETMRFAWIGSVRLKKVKWRLACNWSIMIASAIRLGVCQPASEWTSSIRSEVRVSFQSAHVQWNTRDFDIVAAVVIGCGLTPVKICFCLRLQKNCPRRNTTTTCKGTAHGLTYKMNVYIKFNKKIYISKNSNIYFKKNY